MTKLHANIIIVLLLITAASVASIAVNYAITPRQSTTSKPTNSIDVSPANQSHVYKTPITNKITYDYSD